MKARILLVLCILLCGRSIQAQTCDTVYRFVQHPPEYIAGESALHQWIFRELIEITSQCQDPEENPISKLHIWLTTDRNGIIVEAYCRQPELSERCRQMLCNKLIGMKGWKPATNEGQTVCCTFPIFISCLRWQ